MVKVKGNILNITRKTTRGYGCTQNGRAGAPAHYLHQQLPDRLHKTQRLHTTLCRETYTQQDTEGFVRNRVDISARAWHQCVGTRPTLSPRTLLGVSGVGVTWA